MSFVDPKFFSKSRKTDDSDTPDDSRIPEHPLELFRLWFEKANQALSQAEAMTLATCSAEGVPSARMVLLRGLDERGFLFYTNYQSRKGLELLTNPHCALVFYWEPLDRQVRVEGIAERTTPAESAQYFRQRPRGSQIGAWASPQSSVLSDRQSLEERVKACEEKFTGTDSVPCPPFWGGFRVVPSTIEFWQGRENRLHDRLRYRLDDSGLWVVDRLAP